MASPKAIEAPLLSGKVVRFEESRGYGFVAPDQGGEDVFLHANDLPRGGGQITCGTRVLFRMVDGGRGPKAYDVRLSDIPATPAVPVGTAPAVGVPIAAGGTADDTCDALSERVFAREITELILAADATVTAAQIRAIRRAVCERARIHGWVE
jgi:CspA family cold shock protein